MAENKTSATVKIPFQDFAGGPEEFDLADRHKLCCDKDANKITHYNIIMATHVAIFMETNKPSITGKSSLVSQSEKFISGIELWTWSDLLLALKEGQSLLSTAEYSVSSLLNKLVGELVRRLGLLTSDPSSKCTSFRSSCDSRSTLSNRSNNGTRNHWFIEDLFELELGIIDMAVKKMVMEKLDHATISKFLFSYQKSRVTYDSSKYEKLRIVEAIIELICLLDKKSISLRGLFDTLRIALVSKLSKPYRKRLEMLIGSRLDQVTLDYLLIPSTKRKTSIYNVSLVLRLLKFFFLEQESQWQICSSSSFPLKKVAMLIDHYAMEVAPDACLRPSKFAALASCFPDAARHSCDRIYHAMEIFFAVHHRLCEEQKTRICSALNYDKVSPYVLIHLPQNLNFPREARARALVYRNLKLHRPTKNVCSHLFDRCIARLAQKEGVLDCVTVEANRRISSREELRQMGWRSVHKYLGRKHHHHWPIAPKLCCSENSMYLPRLCS